MDNKIRLAKIFKLLRRLDRVVQSKTSLNQRDIEIVEVILHQTISVLQELTETVEKYVLEEGFHESTS